MTAGPQRGIVLIPPKGAGPDAEYLECWRGLRSSSVASTHPASCNSNAGKTQEIKLRASVRIGELVRELDKAQPGPRAEIGDGAVAQLAKQDAVEAAGLTPRTAQRYQELAGPREEQAHKAANAGRRDTRRMVAHAAGRR